MPQFNGIDSYRAHNAKRAEAILNNMPKTAENAAIFTAAKARVYAPMKTGNLRRGIVRRKNVVTARATKSGRTGNFPYIHWVNQTPGMGMTTLTLRRNKRTGRFATPQVNKKYLTADSPFPAVYGITPGNWNYTGQAKFFQKAVYEGRQHFKWWVMRATNKSLRAEFM